ncbi:MAG: trypsin-like serine protease [Deltaproteobacteria bacterium]|nr:trypsin-like serine protease [Nannocystaceae bacterium]
MPRVILSISLLACLLPKVAAASEPGVTDSPDPQHVYGGSETPQCGWPAVGYLSHGGGACTGTLIHPQIVLTAAHCVPGDVSATIRFGERANTAAQLADTEFCRANPGFFQTADGTDYAFCKLATPIDNIVPIPIAFGCEESILAAGRDITHVGYGVDENGESGRKKSVELQVQAVTGVGEIITGSGGQGICSGDSGGPVMTQLSSALGGDDTWRVVGIHSWAQMSEPGVCGGTAGSVIAARAIEFIESESGVDITPCFSASGEWEPTWGCQGFPIDPGAGGEGSYNAMCETGPLGEFSTMCGAPLTDFPDDTAPTLQVISPMGDQVFEVDEGGKAQLQIDANADDGEGWGVSSVELQLLPEDGEMVTESLAYPPYRWNTAFPVGAYNLKLIATDHAGNVTDSGWIGIGVGTDAPVPPGDDDTGTDTGVPIDPGTSSDDGGAEPGTTDDGEPPQSGGDSGGGGDQGCAIAKGTGTDLAAGLLGLMLLPLVRRRRGR